MQASEQLSAQDEHPVHACRASLATRALPAAQHAWGGGLEGHDSRRRVGLEGLGARAAGSRHEERRARPDLTGAASEARCTEERIEPELALLVKAQTPIRRAMAALAGRFVFDHCWERLGFARLGDYGTERLGLSARTLYDLAHTDRVLAELPGIDRAFSDGEIGWTKVRLLARVARAEDEGSWLSRAREMTAAALAREVRAADVGSVERGGASGEYGSDGEEPWENVKIRCTSRVAGKWHRARQLACRMAGRSVKPWECGEMVAAEVLPRPWTVKSVHRLRFPRGIPALGVKSVHNLEFPRGTPSCTSTPRRVSRSSSGPCSAR